MNTYKVKAFNAIQRLKRLVRSKASKKSSTLVSQTQPCINKLYAIDFSFKGSIVKNVVARYAGKSKSGRFMIFEPASFFAQQGIQVHLLCLTALQSLRQLKQNLFAPISKAAA